MKLSQQSEIQKVWSLPSAFLIPDWGKKKNKTVIIIHRKKHV